VRWELSIDSCGRSFSVFRSVFSQSILNFEISNPRTKQNHRHHNGIFRTTHRTHNTDGQRHTLLQPAKKYSIRQHIMSTTATTSKDEDTDALVCPLCTENMIKNDGRRRRRPQQQQHQAAIQRDGCCQQYVCQSCLYRHVHSILEEGIAGCGNGGAGRTTLTCPLGCGQEMTNAEVRACFHGYQHCQQHHGAAAAFWNLFVEPFIVYPLLLLWILLFPSCCFINNNNVEDDDDEYDDDYFVLRHKVWIYCHSTRAEQNDIRQYERWSLAVALRTIQRQEKLATVMHCPSPNCNYTWLVACPEYREAKRVHERRKVYLWYTPPKPELEHSYYNKTRKSNDNDNFDDWCRPEFLNMSRAFNKNNNKTPGGPGGAVVDWLSAEHSNTTDGRYMCCAKCHVSFCGLCRQPWRFGSKCHVGISCRAYRRQLPAVLQENGSVGGGGGNHDAFAFSTSNDGRCCPGCSMFTSRAGGCNHMTCPCGVEWCYVCEQRWNSLHYGCVDRRGAEYNSCIIS
jgi:hypothetical protein